MKARFISASVGLALAVLSGSALSYADLPDKSLTPGKAATLDVSEICTTGYPARSRKVGQETKRGVYYRYSINQDECRGGCKIDHLIPLAIGGSNAVTNLWPHEYGAEWNVYAKTRLEVRLRQEVCSGQTLILTAQECIADNWHACYEQRFGKPKPKTK